MASEGNPQVYARVPEQVKAVIDSMNEAGAPLREVLVTVAEVWATTKPQDGAAFLASIRKVRGAAQEERDLSTRDAALRERARQATIREKELAKRETAATEAEEKAQATIERAEARAATSEAKTALRRQVIEMGEALLRAAAKPADVEAVYRTMKAASLAPESVAAEVERLGGVVNLFRQEERRRDAAKAEADKARQEADNLRAEVEGLTRTKTAIIAEVRAATGAAGEEFTRKTGGAVAHLQRVARQAETALEGVQSMTKTLNDLRAEAAQVQSETEALRTEGATLEVWVEVLREAKSGRLLPRLRLENVPGLCAALLAADLEERGDAEIPTAGSEVHYPKLSLSSVAAKLQTFAEVDRRPKAADAVQTSP